MQTTTCCSPDLICSCDKKKCIRELKK
jgi:hypothetical protein